MFCKNCGRQIPDNSQHCQYCGQSTSNYSYSPSGYTPRQQVDDQPSWGLNILSFLIPLAGWIIYFAIRANKPERARACAIAAWIGFAVNLVISFASM